MIDPTTGHTPNPKVWAIGDIANGGAEVVNAVQAGKLAARVDRRRARPGPRAIVPVRPAESTVPGVDLFTDMAGIRGPNPFWLASCPITNTGEMVARAFDAGWGGVVWKTIGDPIRNVTSRLGALDVERPADRRPLQHRADQRPPDRGEPRRDRARSSGATRAGPSSSR